VEADGGGADRFRDCGARFYFCCESVGQELEGGARGWTGLPGALALLLIWSHWFVPEWIFAATIGKAICDLRVAPVARGTSALGRALKRNLVRPFDFFFFYLVGFIVAMSNPGRQRLGDLWAHTMVISAMGEK
jgi:uncharacterized RDD family membrane protein YckC